MHPMVKPALRRSWRDRTTVQFGIRPGRAAVLEGVDRPTEHLLDLLDGTRSLDRVRAEAAGLGLGAARVGRLLGLLREGGVLDDAEAAAPLHGVPEAARERLRPDLASLSVVHPAPGAAAARLAARRRKGVQVRGAGRVGASVASLLAAAGVGRVDVVDSGRVEPWDTSPSGTPASDAGRQRAAAARAAVRRAATAARAGSAVDLVVFAPRNGLDAFAPDPGDAAPLVRAGIAHVYAGVLEDTGFVGPLFAPPANEEGDGEGKGDEGRGGDRGSGGSGRSDGPDRSDGSGGCAGCLALHRAEADPAWPRVLAQLRSGRPGPLPACDTAMATTVAGLAAVHALMLLDGGTPSSVGARVEVSLADTSVTVRAVPRHSGCECAGMRQHGSASVGDAPAAAGGAQVTMGVG